MKNDDSAESPKFLSPLPQVTLKEGQTAEFSVQVIGKPDITWFREKTRIEPNGDDFQCTFDGNVATLKIKDTNIQDSGVITCVARNAAGTCSSSAELQVRRKYHQSLYSTIFLVSSSENFLQRTRSSVEHFIFKTILSIEFYRNKYITAIKCAHENAMLV